MIRRHPAAVVFLVCGLAAAVGPFVYFLGPDLRGHLPRLAAVPPLARRTR